MTSAGSLRFVLFRRLVSSPSLKAGQVYSKPVQFRGGWAVFQVVATRPAQLFPTFEQAKPQLQRIAAAQTAQQYVRDITSRAVVK